MRDVARVTRSALLLATCLSAAGASARGATRYVMRVDLKSEESARVDDRPVGAVAALANPRRPDGASGTVATIEDGQLRLRVDGHLASEARANGASEIAWQLHRAKTSFLSLFDGTTQTIVALPTAGGAAVPFLWSKESKDDARGAAATEAGPLLRRTLSALVAMDVEDGAELWRIPWDDTGAPLTLHELPAAKGKAWLVCDRDVVALDRASGKELWRKPFKGVTECIVGGARVFYSSRTYVDRHVVDRITGALDAKTGASLWTAPYDDVGAPLLVVRQRVLTVREDGVALLEAKSGAVAHHLGVSGGPWTAELLPGGDVLLHGKETLRIGLEPLTVRWKAPRAFGAVRGGSIFFAEAECDADHSRGVATLVELDLASGKEKRRLEVLRTPGMCEISRAMVLAAAATHVDVEADFGFLN